jgi:catechol 2,3-dioxygenase-like lactoylglutathione lyase family enzyme
MRVNEYVSQSFKSILKAHIALNVASLTSSVSFYTKLLGVEPLKVRPGYAMFDVQNPPLLLSLNEGLPSGAGPLSHLGLQVATTEDVLAIRNHWQFCGLATRDEMQTSCCYALQDKAWVRDPDGNEWEVFAVLADIEQSGNSCCQNPLATSEDLVQIGIENRHE